MSQRNVISIEKLVITEPGVNAVERASYQVRASR